MGKSSTIVGGQGGLGYIAEPLRALALPIDTLHPDPSNARVHDERNLASIVASLSRFGQRLPIVVQQQGMIVRAGNGRLAAAKSLGWTHMACVVVDEASVDATAYAIADNRTAELATWDDETLAALLQSLPDDARLAAGYDDGELKELLDGLTPPEVVEDEAPAPLPTPVSKTGDLWVMGGHRLLCGDSTKAEDVASLMSGEKAQMGFTSPPYNAGNSKTGAYGGGSAKRTDFKAMYVHEKDAMDVAEYLVFLRSILDRSAEALDDTGPMLWNVAYNANSRRAYGEVVFAEDSPLPVQETVVWNKGLGMNIAGSNIYSRSAELVFILAKTDRYRSNQSGGVYWNLWDISSRDGDNMQNGHGASFPVELPSRGIEQHSSVGDVIYEPFSGSGTTIVAAEQLGRRCFAIEIEPLYVDVAVRRWQKLTGKDAVLESTGKTWADTAADRGVTVA